MGEGGSSGQRESLQGDQNSREELRKAEARSRKARVEPRFTKEFGCFCDVAGRRSKDFREGSDRFRFHFGSLGEVVVCLDLVG